jgi:hypothetical protein
LNETGLTENVVATNAILRIYIVKTLQALIAGERGIEKKVYGLYPVSVSAGSE